MNAPMPSTRETRASSQSCDIAARSRRIWESPTLTLRPRARCRRSWRRPSPQSASARRTCRRGIPTRSGAFGLEPEPRDIEQVLDLPRQRPEPVGHLLIHLFQVGEGRGGAYAAVDVEPCRQVLDVVAGMLAGMPSSMAARVSTTDSGSGRAAGTLGLSPPPLLPLEAMRARRDSTASDSSLVYRSKPTAAMWPLCWEPRYVAGAPDLQVLHGDLESGGPARLPPASSLASSPPPR